MSGVQCGLRSLFASQPIRVPLPNIGCSAEEVNAVRGMGDEFALRIKYRDNELHSRRSPRAGPALEMFQWIEDARVAAIGSLRMQGVAQNLDAALEVQCKQSAFDTVTVEADAPLSVAVGLLVRQHMTGRELPPSAENVVRFWRDYVEEHAGDDIDALKDCLLDQALFAERCRTIIADLGLAAELDEQSDFDDSQNDTESMDEDADSDSDINPDDVVLDDESMVDENADGESTMVEMDADMDMDELGAEADPDEAPTQLSDDGPPLPARTYNRLHAVPRSFIRGDPDHVSGRARSGAGPRSAGIPVGRGRRLDGGRSARAGNPRASGSSRPPCARHPAVRPGRDTRHRMDRTVSEPSAAAGGLPAAG